MPRLTARSVRLVPAVLLLFPAAPPLIAQDAFSALAARLTEARTLSRAGDHARAIPLVDSLYAVLPSYPNMALLRGAAMARAGRDAEAVAMLRRLLAWDPRYARVLLNDSSFAALRARVADLDIPRRADLAGAPVARAQVLGVIEERDFVPEGTAYDPQSRRVLVGSIYKGKVVAIGPDGRVRELIPPGTHGLASVVGIHVDGSRRILWVTSNARFDVDSDTTSPALYAFDVSTGAFRARYAAPPGRHFLNDVTTMPDGTVYVSDTRAGRIWRLSPGTQALEPVTALGPLLSPNGITTDGRRLFVSDIDHIRVLSPESGESWRLEVPDSIDVSGIDGLAWADGSLIAHHWGTASSRIARYPLDAARRRITGRVLLEANTLDVRTSTTGEVAGSEYVFIGNSQLDRMNARTVDSATMHPVRIYRVPLTPAADGLVAVALSARDSVVLLDPGTLERVAALRVGKNPHEIAPSPDGRRAYVADAGDTTITVLDIGGSPRVAATWALPDTIRVHDVAVSADGRSVWAASAPRRLVLRLDAASGRVLRRYPLTRDGAWMLESGPDGQVVVSHLEGGALAVLDAASGRERVLPLAVGEIDGTFTPDGNELWSVNLQNGALTVLDARTGAVIATDRSGSKPVRVTITPDGAKALMVSEGDSSVVAFDTRSKRRLGAAPVAAGPKVIALSPDGRRAYVSHPERGLVTLLDVPSLTVMRTVAVPGTPDGVAVLQARPER
jgi:YVTN family beta-propeller protein